MQESTYIAVLGDLHGHITLAYRLLKRWEKEHGKLLQAIFQVGDFGAFPPPFKVDKATMRFYQKDPDELSFIDYYDGSTEADEILAEDGPQKRKIAANLYFIKGNHEDFEYLQSLSSGNGYPIPVDVYGKIFYLPNGNVYSLPIGQTTLKIASLGGISQNNHGGKDPKSKFYTKSEYRQLCETGNDIDIFLSHDVPYNSIIENAGSKDILDFIEIYQPKLHFCGHFHEDGHELTVPGNTKSYILNEVNFRKPSQLNFGCISIVEISADKEHKATILDDHWVNQFTKDNFRNI
jgi:hypothetical protein